jgi:oligopeptide transport system substrate-binding protein
MNTNSMEEDMTPYKKWAGLVAIVVIISMLLSACTPTATPQVTGTAVPTAAPKAAAEKVLRVNLGTYPDIIDPQKSSYVNEIGHLQLIYEGLTKFNTKLETVPGAAESWQYNADATELTFTLRDGLKYSDGTVLNAMRFKYAIMRNIDPSTAGEYAYITDYIKGAPEWRGTDPTDSAASDAAKKVVDASVQAFKMDGTTACTGYDDADCRILKVTMSQPTPFMHTVLGIWVGFPAKEENIAAGGENWWDSSKFQIGNGPFILKTLEPFVRALFVPNPNYWDVKAKINIEYSYINDSSVAFQAYKNNEFDIVGLAAEDLATVQADPVLSKEATIYPGSCTFDIMFNLTKEPFNDAKVRQAFAMSLDRKAYVADVLKGLGAPALSWIPAGVPGANATETRWDFNVDAAKQALAGSKYVSADKLPKITATFADSPRNRTRWEWMANNWKTNLGVTIELNPIDPTAFTALTKDINTMPQMILLGWCSDYPDAQDWLSVYWESSASFAKNVGYSNPEIDKLLAEADKSIDPVARLADYVKAQDMLIAEMPAIMFYNSVNAYMVKPWVKGIQTTPQDATFPGFYAANLIDIDTTMLP